MRPWGQKSVWYVEEWVCDLNFHTDRNVDKLFYTYNPSAVCSVTTHTCNLFFLCCSRLAPQFSLCKQWFVCLCCASSLLCAYRVVNSPLLLMLVNMCCTLWDMVALILIVRLLALILLYHRISFLCLWAVSCPSIYPSIYSPIQPSQVYPVIQLVRQSDYPSIWSVSQSIGHSVNQSVN